MLTYYFIEALQKGFPTFSETKEFLVQNGVVLKNFVLPGDRVLQIDEMIKIFISRQQMSDPQETQRNPEQGNIHEENNPQNEGVNQGMRDGEERNYGYYTSEGTIVIDAERARAEFQTVVPELATADQHKVTGFVHTHEIFHQLVREYYPELLEENYEEELADIFARNILGLASSTDITRLDNFIATLGQSQLGERLQRLRGTDYDDGTFLLAMHQLGVEYAGNIQVANIVGEIPAGARAISRRHDLTKVKAREKEKVAILKDLAMKSTRSADGASTTREGGINFNSQNLNIQTKGARIEIPMPDLKMLEATPIEGFVPVIINITPVTNLMMILGLSDKEEPENATTKPSSTPKKISKRELPAIRDPELVGEFTT